MLSSTFINEATRLAVLSDGLKYDLERGKCFKFLKGIFIPDSLGATAVLRNILDTLANGEAFTKVSSIRFLAQAYFYILPGGR